MIVGTGVGMGMGKHLVDLYVIVCWLYSTRKHVSFDAGGRWSPCCLALLLRHHHPGLVKDGINIMIIIIVIIISSSSSSSSSMLLLLLVVVVVIFIYLFVHASASQQQYWILESCSLRYTCLSLFLPPSAVESLSMSFNFGKQSSFVSAAKLHRTSRLYTRSP